ncbi:hypothetical protein BsWGS_05620 [Bradybaena similaris]
MSKLLSELTKTGLALGMSGDTLIQWVETKHQLELERMQAEDATKRELALAKEKTLQLEREQTLEKEKTLQAIEIEKHKLDIEASHQRAEMELRNNLEQLRIKTEADFRMMELKGAQAKDTSEKTSESKSSDAKGYPHTRIRLPCFRENVDDLTTWLDRYELICTMENLDRKHWATKIVEFFTGEPLNLIFNLKLEDRQSYDKVKEALLVRFSFTPERLRQRFWESLPERKQTFIDFSSHLERIFDRWIKSCNIELSYSALRELILTSKILDSVDKALYSYIIEQKPSSLDSLIKLAVNFCEAHPGTHFSKQPSVMHESAFALSHMDQNAHTFTSQQLSHNTPQSKKNKKKAKFMTNQQAFNNSTNNQQSPNTTNHQFQNNQQPQQFFQHQYKKGPHFQYYNRGRPWSFNQNWGYKSGYNNNIRFNNSQNQQYNNQNNQQFEVSQFNNSLNQPYHNYRGNNYRNNFHAYNPRQYYTTNSTGNSAVLSHDSANRSNDFGNVNHSQTTNANQQQFSNVQTASFIDTLPSESCPTCATLYHRDQDTILQCGHTLPIAALAANSQGNLKFDHGYANDKPVRILRDTGSTILAISRHLLNESDISDKTLKCVTIGGTVENFNLTTVNIRSPYISGQFDALILPSPIVDIVIGNLPNIQHPTEEQILQWNKDNGFENCSLLQASAITTRASARKESLRFTDTPIESDEIVLQPDTVSVDKPPNVFVTEQEADASLASCLTKVGKPPQVCKKGTVKFIRTNNIVCRVFTKDDIMYKQILLPLKYRNEALHLAHDIPVSAHLAVKKTTDRIKRHFFWPGMTKEIRDYCRSCPICQKMAKKGTTAKAPIQSGYVSSTPWERISMDIIGPMPTTRRNGNQYILTVVDTATRWPEAVALKSVDSESICEALLGIFSRFGFPDAILSDNGPQFTSALTAQVAKTLGIKQLFCSVYHAQANGLCEKLNGVLKTLLAKITYDHPEDWDFYLNMALFALREITHQSIGLSPFEMMLGSQPKGILSLYSDFITHKEKCENVKDTYSYVIDLRHRIITSCNLAQQALQISGEKSRTYLNKNKRLVTLKTGDKVLILLPEKKNKLLISWQGPFSVIKQASLVDYIIDIKGKHKIFHVNMLRKYYERPAQLQEVISNALDDHLNTANTAVISLPDDTYSEQDLPNTIIFPTLIQKETIKDIKISNHLSNQEKKKVTQVLDRYQSVFSDIPGKTTSIQHKIVLTSDTPVRSKPYPIPLHYREAVQKEIQELLQLGIIEESYSDYLSPLVVVKKADNSLRLCVDFRRLNSITRIDPVPMPNISDLLAQVAEAKLYTKLDLSKGFYQIPLNEDSIHLTSFASAEGLYHFRYLPFGLVNSPSTFVRLMRKVLGHHKHTLHYFDDILVYSANIDEHLSDLSLVLDSLKQHGLTAKPSKTEVAFTKLTYLGHRIGGG